MEDTNSNLYVTIGALGSLDFNLGSGEFDMGLALSASRTRESFLSDASITDQEVSLILFSEDLGVVSAIYDSDEYLYDPREEPGELIVTILAGESLQQLLPLVSNYIKGSSDKVGGIMSQVLPTSKGYILVQHIMSSSGWAQFGAYPFCIQESTVVTGVPFVVDSSDEVIDPKEIFEKYLKSGL